MPLSSLLAYGFALFVVALIPGPGITALVARALGAGRSESLAMGLGLILGDMVFLTAAVLGLAVVAQTFGTVFLLIKIAGALYLLWIAFKIWTSGLVRQDMQVTTTHSLLHAFASGLFVTLGNPKAMLFYMALVPTLVDLAALTWPGYGVLLAVTFLVLLAVVVPYCLLAAKARDLLREPSGLKLLNRSAAVILAATAIFILIRSV
jgi:threonine/homoserine/homoserine lactone efflux protein